MPVLNTPCQTATNYKKNLNLQKQPTAPNMKNRKIWTIWNRHAHSTGSIFKKKVVSKFPEEQICQWE